MPCGQPGSGAAAGVGEQGVAGTGGSAMPSISSKSRDQSGSQDHPRFTQGQRPSDRMEPAEAEAALKSWEGILIPEAQGCTTLKSCWSGKEPQGRPQLPCTESEGAPPSSAGQENGNPTTGKRTGHAYGDELVQAYSIRAESPSHPPPCRSGSSQSKRLFLGKQKACCQPCG